MLYISPRGELVTDRQNPQDSAQDGPKNDHRLWHSCTTMYRRGWRSRPVLKFECENSTVDDVVEWFRGAAHVNGLDGDSKTFSTVSYPCRTDQPHRLIERSCRWYHARNGRERCGICEGVGQERVCFLVYVVFYSSGTNVLHLVAVHTFSLLPVNY